MSQNVSDNDIQQANRLIAFEVINERLSVECTYANVAFLAQCFTQLEKAAGKSDKKGHAKC